MSDPSGPRSATIDRSGRLGSAAEPAPTQRRRVSNLAIGVMALVLAAAIAAALLILPVKAWLNQRDALETGREELSQLESANAELQADVDRLRTRAGIIQAAREELNAVRKREKVWRVLAAPDLPVAFPAGWLYPTIESLITERIASVADPNGSDPGSDLITPDNVAIPTTAPGAASQATVVP